MCPWRKSDTVTFAYEVCIDIGVNIKLFLLFFCTVPDKKRTRNDVRVIPESYLVIADVIYTGQHDISSTLTMLSYFTSSDNRDDTISIRDKDYLAVMVRSVNDVYKVIKMRMEARLGGTKKFIQGALRYVRPKMKNVIRYQLLRTYMEVAREYGPHLDIPKKVIEYSEPLQLYYNACTQSNKKRKMKTGDDSPIDPGLGNLAYIIMTYPRYVEDNYKEYHYARVIDDQKGQLGDCTWDDDRLNIPDDLSLRTVVESMLGDEDFQYKWRSRKSQGGYKMAMLHWGIGSHMFYAVPLV